jgi:hypothetical protein
MKKIIILLCIIAFIRCGKSEFKLTEPATEQASQPLPTNQNTNAKIIAIKQVNGAILYNKLTYTLNDKLLPTSLKYYDSVSNTVDYMVQFNYKNDTISVNNNEWLVIAPGTNNVMKHFIRTTYADNTFDDELYTYTYDNANRLIKKKIYVNGAVNEDYYSDYSYDGNNLISCKLILASTKQLIQESKIKYNTSQQIKPWVYFFGDAFENNIYLPVLNYGVKPSNTVVSIVTDIYDVAAGTKIDTWSSSFSGYEISKDNFVLQVTTNGDRQQGLGIYLGTMRFDYQSY